MSSCNWARTANETVRYRRRDLIFQQGEAADSVFRIASGLVKLVTLSPAGKEAVTAILDEGNFFGESVLIGIRSRPHSAIAVSDCCVQRFSADAMRDLLRRRPDFSAQFTEHLIARNRRYEEDLSDQLSNSSEKRLARILLLLGARGEIPRSLHIDQQTLAEMVGTTRSRVCYFMNKFRRCGLIDYSDGIEVRQSLEQVILRD